MPRTVVFEKWRTPREIPSSSWWRMGPFLLQQISAFLVIRCSVANLRPLGSYVHEIVNELSRWWQFKAVLFSPRKLGNDPIWLIFLGMGWNHQLDCAINNWFMWVVTVRKKLLTLPSDVTTNPSDSLRFFVSPNMGDQFWIMNHSSFPNQYHSHI